MLGTCTSRVEVQSLSFIFSALDMLSRYLHSQVAILARYLLDTDWVGPRSGLGTLGKVNSLPPVGESNDDCPVIQRSHYAD